MPSIADQDREYYLGAVSGSNALMTNSDLERAYYLQMLGLSDPSLLTNTDLKYKFFLANATGGNSSMSISDLERMYYLAQAGLSEPYPGSISDLRQSVPKGNINLLTPNQASGTDVLGTTAGFIYKSELVSSTKWAAYGLKSLEWTISGAVYPVLYVTNNTDTSNNIPVVVGQTYTFTVTADTSGLTGVNLSELSILIDYFDNLDAPIGQKTSKFVNGVATATLKAPVGTIYVTLRVAVLIGTAIVGEKVRFDKFGFWVGTSTTWAMPPGSPVWTPVNLLTTNQASSNGGFTTDGTIDYSPIDYLTATNATVVYLLTSPSTVVGKIYTASVEIEGTIPWAAFQFEDASGVLIGTAPTVTRTDIG